MLDGSARPEIEEDALIAWGVGESGRRVKDGNAGVRVDVLGGEGEGLGEC